MATWQATWQLDFLGLWSGQSAIDKILIKSSPISYLALTKNPVSPPFQTKD